MSKTEGVKKCAEWLAYCLSIGWNKSDLTGLENIWHKFKDENGNLKPNNSK